MFEKLEFSPNGIGIGARIRFENGYEASVVRGPYTYGGREGFYELAVLHEGRIVYDTPVTGDVCGWLTEEQVSEKLAEIEALPVRTEEEEG